tara:strand:- start:711 stop:1613 length:903 start_codon:yes stop_codon:yes gene_type:complete
MRYVVTGGAGFVGSYLVKLLVKEGHKVAVIDNLHKGKKENLDSVISDIEFFQDDIRDIEKMREILVNIDGVFHQAALTVVQESFVKKQEYYDVNVRGTENIFKLALENKFKVVFASSSSVYGHKKTVPIIENMERDPINPYGQTKLDDEYLAEKYSKLGVEISGLRYFNIFGKGQTPEYAGVITKFLERIGKEQPPIIFGDGSQIRDFIYVEDIAKANLVIMEKNVSDLFFNVGTGNAISISELAKMMLQISGLDKEPEFKEKLEGDIMKSQADISLIRERYEWNSDMRLENWLKGIIKK